MYECIIKRTSKENKQVNEETMIKFLKSVSKSGEPEDDGGDE